MRRVNWWRVGAWTAVVVVGLASWSALAALLLRTLRGIL